MINLDKVSEGVDYELIPVEYVDNEAAWDVRILRGEFTETVLRFGTIKYDGERDCLTFDFRVVESPDDELDSSSEDLQEFSGSILEDILERGINEGWVYGTEKKNGENVGDQSRTNDSTESIDE
ncbi:hypothetical protein [Planktomarina sp.]|uniref:hypothetical protein n=1 Tax=Planktomarina sp. TaxID=2024851 RepID=UPI0032612B52